MADPTAQDQRVVFTGISWDVYTALDASRGDASTPRLSYLEGVLEIMVPGRPHERRKSLIGRLIEAFADEASIELVGVGSWTLKNETGKRGAEADESYIVGVDRAETVAVPDFAVEVVVSGGGVSKLDIYKGLGVPEVWFYQDGRLAVYILAEGFYLQVERSQVLSGLDPAVIERCMAIKSPLDAVRALRAEMRRTQ